MIYSDMSRDIRALLDSHGVPDKEVYLDSENSGMIFPEALEAMRAAYLESGQGHPAITNRKGWEAYETLYTSTLALAEAMHCKPDEIAYTHSGTEANNLAINGLAMTAPEGRKKIVISAIEHLSVVFPAEELKNRGFSVVKVPVDREGFVDQEALAREVDKETLLVSVAPVNHEIGTVQDTRAIIEIIRDRDPGVKVHLDACDAFCKVPLDLGASGADMASFSGHKIYGPKGSGALYVREGIELKPVLQGQLSTQKLWPGVENVPAIVGFSTAATLMQAHAGEYLGRMSRLRDGLIDGILGTVDDTLLNGPSGKKRSPDNANISVLYCEGEALTIELSLKGVYVSSGSACSSRILEPSHVLLAIHRKYEEAHGSILMKTTPFHTDEQIAYVRSCIPEAVNRIRSLSPFGRGG
ncbi:cysteine desulfurase [Methanolinea mesophila]|uniref:cysteine desulfurase family protein n=1 Tax=Methanolinea mesophila TaxID=547055 RepID=UPI001AE16A5A|nr:cysteine desulfurase family protein [Methanolinea mesophila]MBP1927478.1 cysteine desulfurase [Methanolinea mesophila]